MLAVKKRGDRIRSNGPISSFLSNLLLKEVYCLINGSLSYDSDDW